MFRISFPDWKFRKSTWAAGRIERSAKEHFWCHSRLHSPLRFSSLFTLSILLAYTLGYTQRHWRRFLERMLKNSFVMNLNKWEYTVNQNRWLICFSNNFYSEKRSASFLLVLKDTALVGHVMSSRTISNMECSLYCARDNTCQSYNYFKESGICELNNETRANKAEQLVPSKAVEYYEKFRP